MLRPFAAGVASHYTHTHTHTHTHAHTHTLPFTRICEDLDSNETTVGQTRWIHAPDSKGLWINDPQHTHPNTHAHTHTHTHTHLHTGCVTSCVTSVRHVSCVTRRRTTSSASHLCCLLRLCLVLLRTGGVRFLMRKINQTCYSLKIRVNECCTRTVPKDSATHNESCLSHPCRKQRFSAASRTVFFAIFNPRLVLVFARVHSKCVVRCVPMKPPHTASHTAT